MELEELYEIYNTIVIEFLKNPRQYDEYGKRVSIDTDMYKAMIAYYGYDKLPIVADDEAYKASPSHEVFHGFTDKMHGRELLTAMKYNLGTGGYTPGLFFTRSEEVAGWYTNHDVDGLEENTARILPVKLGSSNGMKFSKAQDLIVSPRGDLPPDTSPEHKQKIEDLYAFCDSLASEGKSYQGFLKTMKKLSNFSVYLGLDYLEEEKYGHEIVFNRGVIAVSNSNFERFCGNENQK